MVPALLEPLAIPSLAVTETPTRDQLGVWWAMMRRDDLSVAYADAFPETLTDFRLEVAQGTKKLLICLVDNHVAGALWLHDMAHRANGTVLAGWVGGFFLPAYRGSLAVRLWQTARQRWEAQGITHLFAATHIANRRSQAFLARGMGFARVGIYPCFTLFHGQITDVVIYCANHNDAPLAWTYAHRRALRPVQPGTRVQALASVGEETS